MFSDEINLHGVDASRQKGQIKRAGHGVPRGDRHFDAIHTMEVEVMHGTVARDRMTASSMRRARAEIGRAAAEDRLHTKVPAPAKVTQELNEESAGIFVREIVVKPVPFVTVAVRQQFEVRPVKEGERIVWRVCRAEFIKQ